MTANTNHLTTEIKIYKYLSKMFALKKRVKARNFTKQENQVLQKIAAKAAIEEAEAIFT